MSVSPDQIAQAIKTIEAQLVILKQAVGQTVNQSATEGVIGVFDGEFMVEEGGKRHQVPPNYASKTMLVPGDTVKKIDDPNGGQTKYKQIGKVERAKSSGILVKKDGKFEVLTDDGSFKVLSVAIKHYNGEVGDMVYVQFPKNHVKGSYAAVEKVVSQQDKVGAVSDTQSSVGNSAPASTVELSTMPVQQSTVETLPEAAPVLAPVMEAPIEEKKSNSKQTASAPQVEVPEIAPLDSAAPNIVAEEDDDDLV